MAKVGAYNHTGRGKLQQGPRPPFYCPFCGRESFEKQDHQGHIWKDHEKPGMIERGQHITLAGHEEDER